MMHPPSKIEPALIVEGGRAFLPISQKGCGSGCKYCYISAPSAKQLLFDSAAISKLCDDLLNSAAFRPGREGTLISITPETEPFKTKSSTSLVIQIIRAVTRFGNPIQVSTKELLSPTVYDAIDDASTYVGQVLIFTSMSSLSLSDRIEPYAPTARMRFSNFLATDARMFRTCLYLKPFMPSLLRDVDALGELALRHRPNAVCIGMAYARSKRSYRYHHPVHPNWVSPGMTLDMRIFRDRIAALTHIPSFFNSTCVSSFFANREPPRAIWRDDTALCVKCRGCGDDLDRPRALA
jgi:hypothetical protein